MEGEARILQDGIEALALRRHGVQPLERVRDGEHEAVEAQRHRALRLEHARAEALAQPAVAECHRHAGQRHHHHPQEHRALVVGPQPGQLVERRLVGVAVRGDQRHREVGDVERPAQRPERQERQPPLRDRGTAGARGLADVGRQRLEQRQGGRQPQRGVPDLDDHRPPVPPGSGATLRLPDRCSAPATSGGM